MRLSVRATLLASIELVLGARSQRSFLLAAVTAVSDSKSTSRSLAPISRRKFTRTRRGPSSCCYPSKIFHASLWLPLKIEASQTAASWLSFAVTTIGLGSLVSQTSTINEKMAPFRQTRTVQYLGIWITRQPQFPFYTVAKPSLVGLVITAKLSEGFCGLNDVHLSRVPVDSKHGQAGWAVFLSVIHPRAVELTSTSISDVELEKGVNSREIDRKKKGLLDWDFLQTMALTRHREAACIPISRATLLTLLSLTSARQIFRHSDASGLGAAYASYSGQWFIEWPIGGPAIVRFAAHDSHTAATDVYPPSFERRLNKCVQMTAGVISTHTFKCAFTGRKQPGRYVLEYVPKGFPGAHGSRHLYNMMGGKVYEIDYLFARKLCPNDREPKGARMLALPSTVGGETVIMLICAREQEILNHAMDCLPWSCLSWSVHRGLRDILMSFSKPRMDMHRAELAATLRQAVQDNPRILEAKGREPAFVRQHMGEMAAGAVMAGSGNSGDLVRVVTDVALSLCTVKSIEELDETTFWRSDDAQLNQRAIVALTKCFILEWSVEIDYQMYHDLPLQMYFG